MPCRAPSAALELSCFLKGRVGHDGCPSLLLHARSILRTAGKLISKGLLFIPGTLLGASFWQIALKGEQEISLDVDAAPGTE